MDKTAADFFHAVLEDALAARSEAPAPSLSMLLPPQQRSPVRRSSLRKQPSAMSPQSTSPSSSLLSDGEDYQDDTNKSSQ